MDLFFKIYIFKDLLIFFFLEKQQQRGRDRFSIFRFIPQIWLQEPGLGQAEARIQELHPDLPTWVAGAQILGPSSNTFPGKLAGSLIWSGGSWDLNWHSGKRYQHLKWWLKTWCCNTGPKTLLLNGGGYFLPSYLQWRFHWVDLLSLDSTFFF